MNIDWHKKGQRLEDFRNLQIESKALMAKGLVFIWTPKDLLGDIL